MRVQRARGDEAVFRIIHFGILSGSARRYAGRTHDCSTVFRGGRQRVEHRFIQVAVTHTSANDAIIARIYQCFSRKIGCVSVVINNADFRQFIQLRDIEWRVAGMLTCRGTLVVNLTVVNVTQRTVVNRLEGRYVGGVGFGDVTVSSTVSFITTSTPRLAEALSAAVTTALYRLNGPSALIDVDGRIAPTITTGLSHFTVRSRK